jgi:tetratricopeptide (TPR) repeat protein
VTSESLEATQLAKQAQKAYQDNHLDDAIQKFEAAKALYQHEGDALLAAEMANNLCVVFLKADRPQEALKSVEGTPELFLENGDEKGVGIAFGNLASALEACGAFKEAEEALHQAADRFRAQGEEELLLYTQRSLSQLQLRQGRPLEAMSSMQSGLEGQRKPGLKNRLLRSLFKIPSRLLNR